MQQNINNFGYELILPWFTGAMWSSFKPIQYLVIFLQICLVLLVCFRVNASIIKKLVWFLFILAMCVIWLEPWLQMLVDPWSAKWFADLAALIIMTLFIGIVDLGFTALWLSLTWLICR